MPRISLPKDDSRDYDAPVSCRQIAEDISAGLARQAIGAKVDGVLCDLDTVVDTDAAVELVTAMKGKPADADALYLIRHSCAHVMAEAIQRVVPGVLLVYGPPLEDKFYYDMHVPEDRPLSADDFEAIEAEMANIVAEDRPFTRVELPVDEGMSKLRDEGSKYKLDNAERAIEAGSDTLSWYVTGAPGADWEDLCRGPHVPTTGRIGAFKVLSIAASYWHGDASSDRLTRVYGTAFADKKALKAYLRQLEEAKKRDHRVIGKQLKLFHFDESVGQGLALWKPNGAVIREELQRFIGAELSKQGYHQVFTPHIGKLGLYKTSGHFPYYQESQFPPLIDHEQLHTFATEGCSCAELANHLKSGEIDGYLLKPMNCPHHIKIYASEPYSYRDLPIRLAEFGTVYRWEQSGEISGLSRVRGMTQDDAHIFCTEEQVQDELLGCLELVKIIFRTLGMDEYRVRVGLRDPDSAKYVGETANWDKAEAACRAAAQSLNAPYSEEAGEAAFYGPKIDFVAKDVVGREWQLGTVQVDYNLPERFDLTYTGPDNKPHRPVMIHRAPFGSMERFCSVLIEHFAGAFPTWLAPEQVRVLTISEKSEAYGREVLARLRALGVRATADFSDDRLAGKVKVATMMKVPYLLVVGPSEAEAGQVSVRARGIKHDLGAIELDRFLEALEREIETRNAGSDVLPLFEGVAVP
ncbi:MAG: threonine--tRNA ligase [Planctomycetota bacterium]|jgi:threonyl-tRNA synthetase